MRIYFYDTSLPKKKRKEKKKDEANNFETTSWVKVTISYRHTELLVLFFKRCFRAIKLINAIHIYDHHVNQSVMIKIQNGGDRRRAFNILLVYSCQLWQRCLVKYPLCIVV